MTKFNKDGGTTIAVKGDIIELVRLMKMNVPKYEYLEIPTIARILMLEGMNRVFGDKSGVDYLKAVVDIKEAQTKPKRK